jgi:hypothetical protein
MRCVLDTNVVVAGMRSPTGASAEFLRMARRSAIILLVNVALALEYEATCRLDAHRLAAGLDAYEVGVFIDAVLAMAEPVETHFLWQPPPFRGCAGAVRYRVAHSGRGRSEDQDMKRAGETSAIGHRRAVVK